MSKGFLSVPMRVVLAAVSIAILLLPRAAAAQGSPLGPEFRVNTYTTDGQCCASVAADSSGRFVVVWSAFDAAASGDIVGQRFDSSGVPLGPEFRVNTYTTGNQYLPLVASDPSGNFLVVWNSIGQDGSDNGVFAQRYDNAGAALGPEFRVNTTTYSMQRFPAVAFAGTGDFVVVWDGYGIFGGDVFGQRFASSGVPVGPEFRANTFSDFHQTGADIAADVAGNFVVVWSSDYQAGPAGPSIYGQRFAASGAPLGPEFHVSSGSPSTIQTGPSVSIGPLGDFVAVWASLSQEGPSWGVYGQRFSGAGTPLGPEFHVNTHVPQNQRDAEVALDASGNFVVVWTSEAQDGSGGGIFAQRFDSSGVPLGPEFRVNTYTSGDQGEASVAADPLGKFVVVWHSPHDGSSLGTFGQRYSPIFPVELLHFRIE